MGIFNRFAKMTQAKVNNALDEMENPAELLDQKIRDMEKDFNEAKIASAQVLGGFKQTEKKMLEAQEESKDWDDKVKLAMSKGNEELAKKALAKKLEADKSVETYRGLYESQKLKAETIKKNLANLEIEIEKTRNYRDEAIARLANAEASEKVNEILSNTSTSKNSINMDNIERKIAKKESLANGLGELVNENTLEDEFKSLDTVDLDAELAKYKQ